MNIAFSVFTNFTDLHRIHIILYHLLNANTLMIFYYFNQYFYLKVHLLMDSKNQLKSEMKNISQNYIPLKVQIQINKKIFSTERKIQKLIKEKKM